MLRLPAHAGQGLRWHRLRAMFAKMKYAKDFGHAVAYTAGRHAARGLDKGVRRTHQGLNYVASQVGKGIQHVDNKVWERISKNPKLSQAQKTARFRDYKLIRGHALQTGAILAVNAPISAGIVYAGKKGYESGYTKEELKKRRAPTFGGRFKESLGGDVATHPKTGNMYMPKADKRYFVDPRIRSAARVRAKEIKRMRRI